MSIKCSFIDDVSYGADDINYALSRFTTQGVSLFKYTDGDNPLLSIEEAIASFIKPGVDSYNGNSCKVVAKSGNTGFEICPGTAFMPDGSFINIDARHDITDIVTRARGGSSNTVAVYFYRNVVGNGIDIRASQNPADAESGKSVLLAEISGSNIITDRRSYAKSKLCITTPNIVQKFSCPKIDAISPYHEGRTRLRSTHAGIFEGARYVVDAGTFFEIQSVTTTTGDELTYKQSPMAANDTRMYAAYNLVDGVLERWIYLDGPATGLYASTMYVF